MDAAAAPTAGDPRSPGFPPEVPFPHRPGPPQPLYSRPHRPGPGPGSVFPLAPIPGEGDDLPGRPLDDPRSRIYDDLLQRYEPEWAAVPESGVGEVGPVEIDVEIHAHRPPEFDATVTYTLGDRSWAQPFTAAAVTDDQLATEAAAHGLHLATFLDPRRTWALLHPA